MRIVHIITRLIIGGAQENTLLSCEGQHDRGHNVTLITGPPIGPEGSLLERAQRHGYQVIVVPEMLRAIRPLNEIRVYRRLIALLRQLKPDVVHTHSSKAGIIGRWAAHRADAPMVVHTIHGLAFTASTSRFANAIYRIAERETAPITTKIICVADAMRDQSLAANIGTPDQYITVYSGMGTRPFVSPPTPRADVRRTLGLRDEHVAVGTIARLFYLKGHEDLLEIAPALCAKHPNVRFVWVGDGLLRPSLEQAIARMKLTDRFILTGLVPPARIPELANAMDVLVHPSRREGLARAIVQAQLARVPAVAYDIDGNREGMIDRQSGFIVPPFDRVGLGDKLDRLVRDDKLRAVMGAAGREFALRRFDAVVMVEALERVYRGMKDMGETPMLH